MDVNLTRVKRFDPGVGHFVDGTDGEVAGDSYDSGTTVIMISSTVGVCLLLLLVYLLVKYTNWGVVSDKFTVIKSRFEDSLLKRTSTKPDVILTSLSSNPQSDQLGNAVVHYMEDTELPDVSRLPNSCKDEFPV